LPLGCSIILEKKAQAIILRNIKQALSLNRNQLLARIRSFKLNSTLPLTLQNFLNFSNVDIYRIYKRGSWKRLCAEAGVIDNFNEPQEAKMYKFFYRRLLQSNSLSYLKFIKRLIDLSFELANLSPDEKNLALMLHYDIWQEAGAKLEESIAALTQNPAMLAELEEVLDYLIQKVDFIEKDINLGFAFPLKVHSRYSRDQILAAIGLHTFEKAASNREGVAENKDLNVEAFFVTLKKSEKEYSPTTLYDDYAINEVLFHWQSQNSTTPESTKGKSYINHREHGKKILLFVREQNDNEYGLTMSYIFLGEAGYVRSSGARPMNITQRTDAGVPLERRRKVGSGLNRCFNKN
jgi:hypothetical protein